MNKILVFLSVLFLASAVPAALAPGAAPETPLLRDGFILVGVDGVLIGPDSNDVWFFELASDVNDSSSVVKAGTRLELLPSSALEKMVADAKMRSTVAYRLWDGRVTKYKGRNFIFPNYFQPLSKPERPDSSLPARETGDEPRAADKALAVDEPNDVLTMPPELLEKLRARREKGTAGDRRVADSNQTATVAASLSNVKSYTQSADTIFANRTAFLVKQDDGRFVLTPDALGRNIQRLNLRLLPCEALELTEREQSAEPEPVRFKIAGIMTKHKGSSYLLLLRATRAYSHSNFSR